MNQIIIKWLQENNPKVSLKARTITNYCLIDEAICQGRIDIINFLIKNGNDVNKKDEKSCNSLLHRAVLSYDPKTVFFLVKNGANIFDTNSLFQTPLELARIMLENNYSTAVAIQTTRPDQHVLFIDKTQKLSTIVQILEAAVNTQNFMPLYSLIKDDIYKEIEYLFNNQEEKIPLSNLTNDEFKIIGQSEGENILY